MNLGSRQVLDWAVRNGFVFTLVLIRFSGLMTTGPIFGQSVVPFRARLLLILALTFVIAPVLRDGDAISISRFDHNRDGFISSDEAPPHLQSRLRQLSESADDDARNGVPVAAFQTATPLPTAMSGLLLVVGSEFVLGLLLGLGAMIVLSGLQLAGQVVDQQIGLQFGSIINPDLGGETAISSQLFFMLGGMAVLLMEPIGGHLMLVQTLIETFDAMPVGQAVVFGGTPMLLTEMVHQSLLLAVQVAAPVLATMSLVTVCLGYLGHCVPQFNQLVVGFPIRSAVGILVLAVTLSGVSRVVVDAIPESIRQMQIALSG